MTKQVCVTAGGDGAHIHHALRKSAVEAASVACRAQVHHQVRMLSVLHHLSPSGQNVVCVTSAFTIRSECCQCYINFQHQVRMCYISFQHQVRMLSVIHHLSPSGQNVVCVTSAFTIWSECCRCYINFHHQVRMFVLHQLSASGQNVVGVTSAFSIRSECCRCYISFQHQVRMFVLHQLSPSGQNVVGATSAFTIRSKCCLCYISFVVYQSCTVPQSSCPFIIVSSVSDMMCVWCQVCDTYVTLESGLWYLCDTSVRSVILVTLVSGL